MKTVSGQAKECNLSQTKMSVVEERRVGGERLMLIDRNAEEMRDWNESNIKCIRLKWKGRHEAPRLKGSFLLALGLKSQAEFCNRALS